MFKFELINYLKKLYENTNVDKEHIYLETLIELVDEYYVSYEISLDELHLPRRITNILNRKGLFYIHDIIFFDKDDFWKIYGISSSSADLIINSIKAYIENGGD